MEAILLWQIGTSFLGQGMAEPEMKPDTAEEKPEDKG